MDRRKPGSNKAMRFLWYAIVLLGIAVASLVVFKAWPLLHPQVAASAVLDPQCDLRRGPCRSELPGGGRVEFSIEPRTLPVVQPLTLTVVTQGVSVHGVEVDFSGVDMNMGYNRPKLEAVDADRYQGSGMLPVCVRPRMSWEARVLLRTERGLLAAPFRFDTASP